MATASSVETGLAYDSSFSRLANCIPESQVKGLLYLEPLATQLKGHPARDYSQAEPVFGGVLGGLLPFWLCGVIGTGQEPEAFAFANSFSYLWEWNFALLEPVRCGG